MFGNTITGFGDEVGPALSEQIAAFRRLGLQGLDLRSVGEVNVLDLADADLRDVRLRTEDGGMVVQSIGSPVNKRPWATTNKGAELAQLGKAIHAAHICGTRRVRIFTPEVPRDQLDAFEAEMLDLLAAQRDLAEREDVVLLHENDGLFWGAFPTQCRRLLDRLSNDHFRAIFDFSNCVLIGLRPWDDWFPWILPHLDTLHIKDAVQSLGKSVPAGEGEGQMLRTFMFLKEQSWDGVLTLEPHLQSGGPYGGFSGDELFSLAAKALRGLVSEVNA